MFRSVWGNRTAAGAMTNLLLGQFLRPFLRRPAPPVEERGDGTVNDIMTTTRRELAMFASEMMGVQSYMGQFGSGVGRSNPTQVGRGLFRDLIEDTSEAFMVIDPRPGLHIVDVNDAYAAATLTARGKVAGYRLFDVFPDNPDLSDADGVSNLYESIQRAAQSGTPHTMATQRYDVRDASGHFVQRLWQPINTPIYDERGRLAFVLHRANALPAGRE